MKFRKTSFLILLCFLAAALCLTASAAGEKEKPIKELTVYGMQQPKAGKTVAETFSYDTCSWSEQHVVLKRWTLYSDTLGEYLYDSEYPERNADYRFREGNRYAMEFFFEPESGWYFEKTIVYYIIRGVKSEEYEISSDGSLLYFWAAPLIASPGEPLPFSVRCGCTCSFDECLSVNYYVPEDDLRGYENVGFEVRFEKWKGSDMTLTEPCYPDWTEETVSGMKCRKYAFTGISVPEIGNTIYTAVTAEKDGLKYRSQEKTYSVAAYCKNMLQDGAGSDAGLKKLCVNLLNYGAAAQLCFDMNPGNPCSAGLTEAQLALAGEDVEVRSSADIIPLEGKKQVLQFGKTVNFSSAPELIILIRLEEGADPSKLKLSYSYSSCLGTRQAAGGERNVTGLLELTKNEDEDFYRAVIRGFSPVDFCQYVSVSVNENGKTVSDTLIYSLQCYCDKMLHADVTDANRDELKKLQPLCQQMMNYSAAAKEYFCK